MKKPRVLKSWSKRNFPLDIWPHILSRLPVKSVLRFRGVSKSWRSLIDDPDFCRLHLNNFKNNRDETHLFLVQKSVAENNREKICVVRSCKTFKTTAKLGPLDTAKLGKRCVVVNSVDGLVMIRYGQRASPTPELMLWNPSIRRSRKLPPSPAISKPLRNIDLGFGFSPLIKDYKHVRLVLQNGYETLRSISVYTLGTGLWKSIEFKGRGISDWRWTFDYDTKWRVVCFRGALYFTASYEIPGDKEKWELVSFDLSDEVFAFTDLPVDDDVTTDDCGDEEDKLSDKDALKVVTLVDGGCSLGVVYILSDAGCVWVMDSSGDWAKRYVFISHIQEIYPDDFRRPNFLCLNKKHEMFFQWFPLQLTVYNLETGDERNLVKSWHRPDMIEVCVYKESLVLLNE